MLLVTTAGAEPRLFEAVEPHMGTLFRIKLYAFGEQEAAAAFEAAFARIHDLDEILSDYKPDSELNRICRTAVGRPVKTSEDLFRVLSASRQLAEDTHGAFDVTLGPVIRVWREARKRNRAPDAAELRRAGERCGYRKLRLDQAARAVWLAESGMQLDVGGIAKGYAADEALAVLNRRHIGRALVAASGDLAFGDPPPGQRGWKIGVDGSVYELSNAAVSTSGAAEQHLDANGKRYSHIIDPVTRAGLTSDITVTVVARSGMIADGVATAVSVLGAVHGADFVKKQDNLAALIITNEGRISTGGLFDRIITTQGKDHRP